MASYAFRFFRSFAHHARALTHTHSTTNSPFPPAPSHKGFKLFDSAGKGALSLEDLKRLCAQVGEYLPDAVLRDMIDEADLNGDGSVNQDEFIQMMMRTNLFR